MIQSDQSATFQRLEARTDEGGFETEAIRSADKVVERALADRRVATTRTQNDAEAASATHSSFRAPNSADSAPRLRFPPPTIPARRMATLHALQEWEGYVVGIEGDDFVARLVDLTASHSYENEEAVIPLAELSERDASSMTLGSIFRWVIGYRCSAEGTKTRVSQIVFRDLPRMTEIDLAEGRAWAHKVSAAFNQ